MTHAAQALVYATLVDGHYSGSNARSNRKGRTRRSPRMPIMGLFQS